MIAASVITAIGILVQFWGSLNDLSTDLAIGNRPNLFVATSSRLRARIRPGVAGLRWRPCL